MPRAGRLHTLHTVQNTRSRYCTTKSGLATTVWLVHGICRGSRLSGTKGGWLGAAAAAAQGEGHVLPRRVNCSRRPETYRPFRNPVQNVAGFVAGLSSSTVSGISPDKLYRRTALPQRSLSFSVFPPFCDFSSPQRLCRLFRNLRHIGAKFAPSSSLSAAIHGSTEWLH